MTEPLHNLLEQHFDTAFAAPDGIKKLRELILTLAMQGKLVAQDLNDPPASELLKQIEAEKQRLHASSSPHRRGSGQSKLLPPIRPEEVPYELPEGWEWVRLGEIFRVTSGQNLPKDKMRDGDIPVFGGNGITGYHDESNVERPTVVIGRVGYYCGSIHLTPAKAWITDNAFFTIYDEERLFQGFVIWLLKTINLQVDTSATAQPVISGSKIYPIVISLPPLLEQHRIVAKIDQLMAKCDELEALRKAREEKRRAVHAAAIKQLLDTTSSFPRRRESSSSKELDLRSPSKREQAYGGDGVSAYGWNFIQQHFGELYTAKENVAELRKTILQLAVMGRLVPQDPNDPPVSELLKQIEAENQRLHASSSSPRRRGSRSFTPLDPRLRGDDGIKTKSVPPIKPEEVPYELPEGWEWVRLSELGITQTGTTPPTKERENYGDFIPFVGPGDIKNGTINYSGEGLSEQGLSKGRLIDANSILMVCIGGSIGKHAINERNASCNQQINTLTPYSSIPVKYIYVIMATSYFQNAVISQAGGSATPIINKQKWSAILIPLPPLPEQHRIVAKIDQLMALCDRLEQQIDAAAGKQTELLNAVMAEV